MHVAVTGASSGIGMAVARHFGRAGHTLSLVARRADPLHALARELGTPVSVWPTDLARLDTCDAWVEPAIARHGPIDVLVNNAGVQYVEPTLGVDDARARDLFAVDLLAPVQLARRIGTAMAARGSGAIANIASLVAVTPLPGMAHYNAAKAGLARYSESLRPELAPAGVHVLTVYPGPIATPMEQAARTRLARTLVSRLAPIGRPEVLAGLIAHALERRRARVVYPRTMRAALWFPGLAAWVTWRMSPPLNDASIEP